MTAKHRGARERRALHRRSHHDPFAVAWPTVDLLERGGQVAAVVDRFARLGQHGHLVLFSGEAGVGKSALVQELVDRHLTGARVLVGRCDDLFAPRPLGPLADIARDRPGPLSEALAHGDQPAVFDAVLAELAAPPHPSVLVLEDLQWADEATLDLLRFVARRLDSLPSLVLATYRDDVAQDHPIRRAVGSLVGPHVSRVRVPPLSVDAVRALVGDRLLDAAKLHAATGGNPFLLIETLDAEPGSLPVTVRDVVLARAAPLSGPARDALDAASVLGRHAQARLVQAVADCTTAAIDECIHEGLLVDRNGLQAFRHDLVRQAVEDSMTPLRRRQLHARALAALGVDGDVVQCAHHAIGAGDDAAVLRVAWQAAEACVGLGAWTEAARLFTAAARRAGAFGDEDRLRLLVEQAKACLRVEQVDEAIAAGEEVRALLLDAGDDDALGEWEGWLSTALRAAARPVEAGEMVLRSVARLEALGDSAALAKALANQSGHLLVSGHFQECVDVALRARRMAQHFGLVQPAVYALNSYGAALGSLGDTDAGIAALRESLEESRQAGLVPELARATANLAYTLGVARDVAGVLEVLDEGIATCEEHEMLFQLNCLRPSRAEALTNLGRWDEAAGDLVTVLNDPTASAINRAIVLIALARLRTRRGDPGAKATAEEGLEASLPTEEAQLIVPAHLAVAEAAWFAGDLDRARKAVTACLPYRELLDQCIGYEVLRMARRLGVEFEPVASNDEATALLLAEDHARLARFWQEHGFLYEAADAMVDTHDVEEIQRGYEQLMALGARPRANHAAKRLREVGARVARGPRASTQANAAGLTNREVEVAALVAKGLTNAEVAERLVVSAKTVDHHVSAVLSKLGVGSRREVARAATEAGLDLTPTG